VDGVHNWLSITPTTPAIFLWPRLTNEALRFPTDEVCFPVNVSVSDFMQRSSTFSLILAIGTLFLATVSAVLPVQAASVVFDNGAPVHPNPCGCSNAVGSGSLLSSQETAVAIAFSQDTTVSSVKFWTIEGNPDYWDGTLHYDVLANQYQQYGSQYGGPSYGSPSSVLFSGSGVNVNKTATGFVTPFAPGGSGALEYLYTFDLGEPITFTANTIYWLGLHLQANFGQPNVSNAPYDYIYWENTSYNAARSTSYVTSDYAFQVYNPWFATTTQQAFQLYGTSVPEPSAVLGLLGFGTICGFAFRRRRINKQIANS
jgi:hypothetical protein